MPEILGGVRNGCIRFVKGVISGQLLVSSVGRGAVVELHAGHFLMKHCCAVLLVLFALSFLIAEWLASMERSVERLIAPLGSLAIFLIFKQKEPE